ncbi:MAG: DUF1905 domain-containing protein [Chitinophagaceae bacterium]|nr:DUF1905 domain-containing protein [Chitinophagaceae bacterium]
MIQFTAIIKRFGAKGEKTGWTYFEVSSELVQQLKPGNRKEFKVKGKLDAHPVKRVSLLPMGGGMFIFVLNAALRKSIGKKHGAMVTVQLIEDKSEFVFNKDFIECLNDEPAAKEFFESLTGSHQRYFSKWIDDAKTEPTRVKRITMAVNALAKKWGYPEMIRSSKGKLI